MVTNADITLYNKTIAKNGNTWTRTVVKGVSWQETRRVKVGDNGRVTADSTVVFIPFSATPKCVIRKGDIMVRGVIDFELDESDMAKNVKTLRHSYSEAMTVISVAKRDYGSPDMQHWEVVLQ